MNEHLQHVVMFSNADGGVSICILSPEYYQHCINCGLSHEEVMEHILQKDCLLSASDVDYLMIIHGLSKSDAEGIVAWENAVRNPEIIPMSTLPSDGLFRDAWKRNNNTIYTDITKAKEIAHEKRILKTQLNKADIDDKLNKGSITSQQATNAKKVFDNASNALKSDIDNAQDVSTLKAVLVSYNAHEV